MNLRHHLQLLRPIGSWKECEFLVNCDYLCLVKLRMYLFKVHTVSVCFVLVKKVVLIDKSYKKYVVFDVD